MSNMSLIKCPDCGAYNDKRDRECAQCGKQFGIPMHKQDAKKDGNRHRRQRFDDEDDEDGDMNGSGHYSPRR